MIRTKKQQTNGFLVDLGEFSQRLFSHLTSKVKRITYGLLHDLFSGVEITSESYLEFLAPKSRDSHPISLWLRPAFQHRRIRAIFGANLAGAVILAGTISVSPAAADTFPEPEMQVMSETQVVVTTESRFSKPVETIGMSQGFSRFHRGVDLRAPVGTVIHPVATGKVVEVDYGRFGYGHYVLVEHKDGFASLYAHMSRIAVNVGDEVNQESELGNVGLTGWTTGPHLHLELYENGLAVNPVGLIPVTTTEAN